MAWEFFRLGCSANIDILAIQDDGLMPSERSSFYSFAAKHKYRIYSAESRVRLKYAHGGAILLVHTRLRSHELGNFSEDEGQSTSVIVEDFAITSCYQPPTQTRIAMAEHLQEMLVLMPRGMPWFCFGDHNDTPKEHILLKSGMPGLQPMFATDPTGRPQPTRLGGNRCIDYIVTNCPERVGAVDFLADEVIADHKIVRAQISCACNYKGSVYPFRLQKTSCLARPNQTSQEEWARLCHEYNTHRPAARFPTVRCQKDVDDLWTQISAHYDNMLTYACRHTTNAANKVTASTKGRMTFSNKYPSVGNLDRASDSHRIRRLRNFLGRLIELKKLQEAGLTASLEYR